MLDFYRLEFLLRYFVENQIRIKCIVLYGGFIYFKLLVFCLSVKIYINFQVVEVRDGRVVDYMLNFKEIG